MSKKKELKKPPISIIQACNDPNLFGPWFKDKDSWKSWMVFLKTVFNLPLNKEDKELYKICTGRDELPETYPKEVYLPTGRRAGKSNIVALIAVWLACFYDWKPFLSPGEKGTVLIVAADRKQARIIFRYIEAFLKDIKFLRGMIDRETAELFELKNQVVIEIQTASFRSIRGYSIIAALLDEVAFWRSENSTNPDKEIINAIRPGMSTIPGAMMFCTSSPYARKGVLWDAYDRYFGTNESSVLVWKAPTWVMNPTVSQEYIDEEYKKDPASAAAEYGAEFRTDVEAFVSREAVEAVMDSGTYELPPISGIEYVAFTDPSGGSKDSFTLAIAHEEDGAPVLDCVRERKPPFSPDGVVDEYSRLIKKYGITHVQGDRYGGEWPRERFKEYDIIYDVCKKTKSDLYKELLPMINSGTCKLLDSDDIKNQLIGLERRSGRGGKDSIDHAPGGHDDVINAVAGAMVMVEGMEPIDFW